MQAAFNLVTNIKMVLNVLETSIVRKLRYQLHGFYLRFCHNSGPRENETFQSAFFA